MFVKEYNGTKTFFFEKNPIKIMKRVKGEK